MNDPEFWRSVTSVSVLFSALNQFGEPVTPEALDAIQRLLPTATGFKQRVDLAVLLYRYGRPAGDTLAHAADVDGDVTAGTVFALNKDEAHVEAIARMLAGRGRDNGFLVAAVEQWPHKRLTEAAWAGLTRLPHALTYLSLLIAHRDTRVVPLLPTLRDFEDDPTLPVIASVGLLAFQAPGFRETLRQFEAAFASNDQMSRTDTRLILAKAAGEFLLPDMQPMLHTFLRRFADGDPTLLPDMWPDEVAVRCAESLAALRDTSVVLLLEQLLTHREERKLRWDVIERLGMALMALIPPETWDSNSALHAGLGPVWLHRKIAISALRPVPDYLMLVPRMVTIADVPADVPPLEITPQISDSLDEELTAWDKCLRDMQAFLTEYFCYPVGDLPIGVHRRPGATEAEIAAAEEGMGIAFPSSYRAFLTRTNGCDLVGYDIPSLSSCAEIGFFRDRNPAWLAAFTDPIHPSYGPDLPTVPDWNYFVYGAEQEPSSFRPENLRNAVQISAPAWQYEDSVFLLIPDVVFEDGELEVWHLSNQFPGAHRYRSLEGLLFAERRLFTEAIRKLMSE